MKVVKGVYSGVLGRIYRDTRLARLEQYIRALGRKNAVFIWIPKTAGTSVFNVLQANGCLKLKAVHHVKDYFPQRGLVTFGHMNYQALRESGYISRRFDRSAFKFCFSRNPYDRAVSLFFYLQRTGEIGSEISFLDFCRELQKSGCPPIGLFNVSGLSQCNPQVKWIEGIDIDFIGRFETVERDLNQVLERLGLDTARVPHLNATPHKDSLKYYCEEAKRIIEEFYKEDFDFFDYPIEAFRARRDVT